MLFTILACSGFLAFSSAGAIAQSANSFEVASIKPSDPNSPGVGFRISPGALDIRGTTLSLLIQSAYNVRDFQISGGPGWMRSDRYDVMAKYERGAAASPDIANVEARQKEEEEQRERIRALLADRFRLRIRRETKEMQAYVLTQEKSGSKLKEAKKEEPAPAFASNGSKNPERPPGARIRIGRGSITAQSATSDFLAQMLSQQLGRPVIDETGLKGVYDFALEWTPDPGQGIGPGFAPPAGPRPDAPAPAEPGGTSIFSAIQEQLGLKLDSRKAPVEVIVIESVEKPSEN